jgi:hypothetical protein
MSEPNSNTQDARALIAGGFASFLMFLYELENPIIVGKDYPKRKLLDAFYEWSRTCGFDPGEANINLWRHACKYGLLKRI